MVRVSRVICFRRGAQVLKRYSSTFVQGVSRRFATLWLLTGFEDVVKQANVSVLDQSDRIKWTNSSCNPATLRANQSSLLLRTLRESKSRSPKKKSYRRPCLTAPQTGMDMDIVICRTTSWQLLMKHSRTPARPALPARLRLSAIEYWRGHASRKGV